MFGSGTDTTVYKTASFDVLYNTLQNVMGVSDGTLAAACAGRRGA